MSDPDALRSWLAAAAWTFTESGGEVSGPCPLRCGGDFHLDPDREAWCTQRCDPEAVLSRLRLVAGGPPPCPDAEQPNHRSKGFCEVCYRHERYQRRLIDAETDSLLAEGGDDGIDWDATPLGSFGAPPVPSICEVAGRHLLTAGFVHGVHGESEAGKSWLAYIGAAQEVVKGNAVLVIDYEMAGATARAFFATLGLTDDQMNNSIVFVNPETPIGTRARTRLIAAVLALGKPLTFAVVDSVGEGLSISGQSSNDDGDVAHWFRALPKWIVRQWPTCAVVVIDHLSKDISEASAMYPIGSQRKRAAVMTQFWVKKVSAFSRTVGGHSLVVVAKDRHGYFTRKDVVARIEGGPDGVALTESEDKRITTPSEKSAQRKRDRLIDYLTEHPEANSAAVAEHLGVSKKTALDRLRRLESGKQVSVRDGPNGALLWSAAPSGSVVINLHRRRR